jgi:chaperonin GroES
MIQPLEDKVAIKTIEDAQVTKSGIIITGDKEKPQEAIVVAVGTGVTTKNGVHVPIPLEVGQKVIFAKYSGTEVRHEDTDYVIISYNDIIAVIEGEED